MCSTDLLRSRLLLPLALVLGVGCADTNADRAVVEEPAPVPAQAPPPAADTSALSASEPLEEARSSVPWTAGIVQKENEVTGAPVLAEVRVAENQGFDRVVLEFEEDEIPSYQVEYVDRPVIQCGSGDTVDLPGDAWLMIRLTPAAAHDEQGRPTIDARRVDLDLPVLVHHRIVCDFEGHVDWVLAARTPNRFRVMELFEPARLVVDVRH